LCSTAPQCQRLAMGMHGSIELIRVALCLQCASPHIFSFSTLSRRHRNSTVGDGSWIAARALPVAQSYRRAPTASCGTLRTVVLHALYELVVWHRDRCVEANQEAAL
jgi:hypothetical protein